MTISPTPVICPTCQREFGRDHHARGGFQSHLKTCGTDWRDRFWAKVDKTAGPNACWPWTASRKPNGGYGQFYLHTPTAERKGKMFRSPRLAWILTHGDPGRMEVGHSCHNALCVNPAHLYLCTHDENIADRVTAERTGNKLNTAKAREIKARIAAGEQNVDIARDYGVKPSIVSAIKVGRIWRQA